MRTIGKLPDSVLILEFLGMMLLAVSLLSVSDYLSLPMPFSTPEAQNSDDFSRCFAHASRCGGGYSSGCKTACPATDESSTRIFMFRKRKR